MNDGSLNLGMASLADTGQWRQIVEISSYGMSAVLKNTDFPETPAIVIFKTDWNDSKEDLLANIEAVVYDNPRMLEDYSTQVVLNTPRSLWIPSVRTDDEEFDPELFTCVYPVNPDDINADFGREEVCLYTLVPGLGSFLQRTLPGVKINSHLSVLKKVFETMEANNINILKPETKDSIYVNIQQDYADIFAFHNGEFLCGASHDWAEATDLLYRILMVAKAYTIQAGDASLSFIAPEESTKSFRETFAKFFKESTALGIQKQEGLNLPTATALSIGERLHILNPDHENN